VETLRQNSRARISKSHSFTKLQESIDQYETGLVRSGTSLNERQFMEDGLRLDSYRIESMVLAESNKTTTAYSGNFYSEEVLTIAMDYAAMLRAAK
jgi:hypothetical protein